MNIFFKIDGKIVTPMLNGSILPGITRDSVLHYCREKGIPCEERRISVDELIEAQNSGKLEEVFGSGTAAVISPVGSLRYKEDVVEINNFEIGTLTQTLYDTLTGIQYGKVEDTFGWTVKVD
jgi:branched-chain amino acid aminotransferase